jgi:hypothetical protein
METVLPTRSPPRYSYKWARDVHESFYKKHARAADTVYKILDLTPQIAITMIATPGSAWNTIRDFVKTAENWSRKCDIEMIIPDLIAQMKRQTANSNEKLELLLTNKAKQYNTKRVGKTGRRSEREAIAERDERLQLYLFPELKCLN